MRSETRNTASQEQTHPREPAWMTQAKAEGLLPSEAKAVSEGSRPWPVVLLTAFGAWLAGLPLLAMIGLTFGDWLVRGEGGLIVLGLLFASGAVVMLRANLASYFFEQLAVPMMWAGVAAMAWGMSRFLPPVAWASFLALSFLTAALLLSHSSLAWLRTLLGASSVAMLFFAFSFAGRYYGESQDSQAFAIHMSPWLTVHLLGVAWGLWYYLGHRHALRSESFLAQSLPAFATGWVLMVLVALAWFSGSTFLLGNVFGAGELPREVARPWALHSLSVNALFQSVFSAGLAVWAGWCLMVWFSGLNVTSSQREQASVASWGVCAVLAMLCWVLPMLGAVLLIAALALRSQRYRLATFAAMISAWIMGSFYYQLSLPLATKAVILVGVATVLAGLAYWAHRLQRSLQSSKNVVSVAAAASWKKPVLLLCSAVLTLGIANTSIWQKEQLIAQGKPVFVRLAPRDPRSLMQGDYMALNFALPERASDMTLAGALRPLAVGKLALTGVLDIERIARPGDAIAQGETIIELTPKDGRWTLVSDAWFFKEGNAERWEQARYGEFRVMPNGKALLVGMTNEKLQPIKD